MFRGGRQFLLQDFLDEAAKRPPTMPPKDSSFTAQGIRYRNEALSSRDDVGRLLSSFSG